MHTMLAYCARIACLSCMPTLNSYHACIFCMQVQGTRTCERRGACVAVWSSQLPRRVVPRAVPPAHGCQRSKHSVGVLHQGRWGGITPTPRKCDGTTPAPINAMGSHPSTTMRARVVPLHRSGAGCAPQHHMVRRGHTPTRIVVRG